MTARLAIVWAAFILAAVACGSGEESAVSSPTAPTATAGGAVDFEPLLDGDHSGVVLDAPAVEKIETRWDWEALWARHQATSDPPAELPEIDFENSMLIAVFDMDEATGGYSIEVQEIIPGAAGLTVFAVRTSPGRDCLVTQAFTQPFHIVVVDRVAGPAHLSLSEDRVDCQ